MAISGIQLRCPTEQTKSITVVAPSPGATAGAMDFVGNTIGVYYKTVATGEDVAMCIAAHKILLPKLTGTSNNIAQGGFIYFTDGAAGVTGASGGTKCGRALVAAGPADATVLAVFNGDVAA